MKPKAAARLQTGTGVIPSLMSQRRDRLSAPVGIHAHVKNRESSRKTRGLPGVGQKSRSPLENSGAPGSGSKRESRASRKLGGSRDTTVYRRLRPRRCETSHRRTPVGETIHTDAPPVGVKPLTDAPPSRVGETRPTRPPSVRDTTAPDARVRWGQSLKLR